ncbi:MAG: hypothetical protein Q4D95_05900 [Peptoniphilus sp.]|nr:hypothetical protein [Peptoniphilus sp.]
MLKSFQFDKFKSPYEDRKRGELGEIIAKYQRICVEENIPVIIMIDGWESSGKGYVLNDLVRDLDAKHYRVSIFDDFDETDDYSYTSQFWKKIPAKGDFAIFDRSMYYHMFNDLKSNDKIQRLRIKQIMNLEKLLYDDHTILIKFFLHESKKRQSEAIDEYLKDEYRNFLVGKEDIAQNKHYEKYLEHFNLMINGTDFSFSPWNIVSSEDRKIASKHVLGTTIEIIERQIEYIRQRRSLESNWKQPVYKLSKSLSDFELSKELEEEYDELSSLQKKAGELAYALHTKNVPVVLVFEGMDAAGKGGAIQRLLRKIDARSYNINPTSAPSDVEKDHHYLWRFYNNFPKDGYMSIFDRSWYGRVMVERVEGFANEYEWSRAYGEINNMEKELVDYGTLLIKYLLVISKDEQQSRFESREQEKPYKITEEDWRNREKWQEYIDAMDEMLYSTSTGYAPWTIVSGESKKHARIHVLKEFIFRAEEFLKKLEK